MTQDILVVDDDRIALENFGNEVRLNLNIEPFLTDSPQNALAILRDYPIKVLVTDQVMPSITGIELVRQIREDLKLKIPCIMLTGAPQNLNSFDLVRLQFFDFIDKVKMHSELVDSIRRAIQRYDADEVFKYNIRVDSILSKQRKWIIFGSRVALRLLRISSIIDPYTKDQDWHTEYTAQKGLNLTQKINIHRRIAYSCEYGIDIDMIHSTGLKTSTLASQVESSLQNKLTFTGKVHFEGEVTAEAEQTIEVKEITDAPTSAGLILQSREYQSAPVYVRINCVLEINCTCCQIPKTFNASLDLPTDKFALRQVEHFDKGPDKKIYTGFVQGSFMQSCT